MMTPLAWPWDCWQNPGLISAGFYEAWSWKGWSIFLLSSLHGNDQPSHGFLPCSHYFPSLPDAKCFLSSAPSALALNLVLVCRPCIFCRAEVPPSRNSVAMGLSTQEWSFDNAETSFTCCFPSILTDLWRAGWQALPLGSYRGFCLFPVSSASNTQQYVKNIVWL